jgi:fimbrial chaperone protein
VRLSVLAVLGCMGTAAHALTISPVLVDLSPARRVVSITIANPGDRAISFQTEALAWSQQDGMDKYDETDELMVVPPIAEIAAGGSQIFRVTLRGAPGAREQAYRLIFEDVSEATAPSPDEVSVNIRINHNLPVFVAAPGKPRAQPRLGPCPGFAATGKGCVRLDNDGNRYAQVKSVVVEAGDWHKDLNAQSRVLAGAWRQWTFDLPGNVTGALQVKAETTDGPLTLELRNPAH